MLKYMQSGMDTVVGMDAFKNAAGYAEFSCVVTRGHDKFEGRRAEVTRKRVYYLPVVPGGVVQLRSI